MLIGARRAGRACHRALGPQMLITKERSRGDRVPDLTHVRQAKRHARIGNRAQDSDSTFEPATIVTALVRGYGPGNDTCPPFSADSGDSRFVRRISGRSIVNVALPAVVDELGGGITTQQWVLDAYLLTLGSFILLAGSLSDSFGRLHILRLGLVVFGVASVACALAPTSGALIAARAVQGAGAAFLGA